jgi:hypothetical protein
MVTALRYRRSATALLLVAMSGFAQAPPVAHAQGSPSLYDVQAVYLYNFAKFVRWPAGTPSATLDICVAGEKTYVDTLTKIVSGEQINTHPLTVRAIQRPEDVAACGILFIDTSAKDRLDSLIAATAGKPVLTVSDVPGFLDRGGMIQFLLIDNRVRFAVDLRPVDRSGLALSSQLLKVAVSVNGKPGGGGAP